MPEVKSRPVAIGPYRILGTLGQGGMGVVYRAEHPDSGQVVALKTVRVPRAEMLQSIRREIHALASIRHPGIVRILDEGLSDGVPWYAMDLVEGVTLRRMANDLTATDQSADQSPNPAAARVAVRPKVDDSALFTRLTWARRLCAPLAFLHGEGIVHRDLKPDNVLMTHVRVASGESRLESQDPRTSERADRATRHNSVKTDPFWPVLVDFGLVTRFNTGISRDTLDAELTAAGSLEYMAPEQIRGDRVDARTDLYALGCILYELLTGRPPFVGDSPAQLVKAHMGIAPEPPSQYVEGLPPGLDELLLRLLAKSPHERLGHADDVASILAQFGAEDGSRASEPKPRAYLYRPGFAGRHRVLDELCGLLSQLEEGAGGLVLIGGESGVGKTRLALELAREARRRKVGVLTAECLPRTATQAQGAHAAPLHPLRGVLQHIADRCRESPEETERLLGSRGSLLALYEPTLASLAGQEDRAKPAELPAEAARSRLFLYLAETLDALCDQAPMLLLIDDLQWADDLTLGLLGFLIKTRRLERSTLLVVGTYRSGEIDANLQALIGTPETRCQMLDRLEERDVGEIVGDMLAVAPAPEPFIRYLSEQSEGNPFFVAEYLRAAIAQGLLCRDGQSQWRLAVDVHAAAPLDDAERSWSAKLRRFPIPGSLRELVGRRLGLLSPIALQLAEAASVLGREIDDALLGAVTGMSSSEAMEAVQELRLRQILEEAETGTLRFAHDKLREVAYAGIQKARRRTLHREAAKVMESLAAGDPDQDLAALGHHWEQAGRSAKAREYFLAGARRAVTRTALQEAEVLYRHFLRLAKRGTAQRVAVQIELVRSVLINRGELAEASRQLESVRETARVFDQRPRGNSARKGEYLEGLVLLALAVVRISEGRLSQALALLKEALPLHRQRRNREAEAETLQRLAELHLSLGHVEPVHGLLTEALQINRELHKPSAEATVLGCLARFHAEAGRFADALRYCDLALRIQREHGDQYGENNTLRDYGVVCHELGRFEEARDSYEKALAFYREIGDPRSVAMLLTNLGQLFAEHGLRSYAMASYQESLGQQSKLGLRKVEGITLTYKAALERRSGELDEADRSLQQAQSAIAEAGTERERVLHLCELAHLALARAEAPVARQLQSQAHRAVNALQSGSETELGRSIQRLSRAIEAYEAGRPLFGGECWEDIPEGLRRWLMESREVQPPPAERPT